MSEQEQPAENPTDQQPNKTMLLLAGALLLGVAVLAGALFAGYSGLADALLPPSPTPQAGVNYIDPPRELMDFTIRGTDGEPLSLSDLRGKHTLLAFGYTHCPDFCPMTLAEFNQIYFQLEDRSGEVNFAFISFDEDRDTPAVVGRYLERFNTDFIGMSGDSVTLARISPDYGLYYEIRKDMGGNYPVDHTTASYLIDPDGRLTAIYSFGAEPEAIVSDIQARLAQS